MEILKSILKDIRFYVLTIIVCFIIFFNCKGCQPEPINNIDSKQIHDTIKVLQTKVVTLDSIRTKFVYKWRTVKDTINLTDTVEVLKLLSVCDTIIYTDSVEIQTLKTINFNYAKICRIDSVKIDSLTKSKKKYWKGFKNGFIAGSVLTGSIIWTSAIK